MNAPGGVLLRSCQHRDAQCYTEIFLNLSINSVKGGEGLGKVSIKKTLKVMEFSIQIFPPANPLR